MAQREYTVKVVCEDTSGQSLDKLRVVRKTGAERFHANGCPFAFDVLGFWRWSSSDLVSNAMRGVLAEYLVACDIGVADGTRMEWDAYDLKTPGGVKVEVKSAAYLQSWKQTRLSTICFDIRSTVGWDASTNVFGPERKRQADVYVFALLKHQEKATLDPLNVAQWDFYVLPTTVLNEKFPSQKQMSFTTLLRLRPIKASFGQIATVIASMCQNSSNSFA
jgi:hypothetical protein